MSTLGGSVGAVVSTLIAALAASQSPGREGSAMPVAGDGAERPTPSVERSAAVNGGERVVRDTRGGVADHPYTNTATGDEQ